MSYIKMFSDSPGVQSCKKYIQITYVIFLLCQNQFQSQHSRRKWRPLTAWTLGQQFSQLTVGESTLQSGACFGTFLRLCFQSSLWQVRDENSKENGKKETTYTLLFQFRHWTCLVHIPGNTMGNPFLATTWMYGFCGFLLSFGVLLSESLPELTPES